MTVTVQTVGVVPQIAEADLQKWLYAEVGKHQNTNIVHTENYQYHVRI